jgi:hypothetical protein
MKIGDIILHILKKYTLFTIIVLIIFLLPLFLVAVNPDNYNPLAQVLMDLALFGASVWFGYTISNKEAEKRVTDKWLIAAENACNELTAMRESAKTMRLKQDSIFNLIEKIIPGIPNPKLDPLKELVEFNCRGCAIHIADLQNRIENIRQGYSIFVEANCDDAECTKFHELVHKREKEIQATFENIKIENNDI